MTMLYRGVFWVTDPLSPNDNMITFKLPCDSFGNFTETDSEFEAQLLCKEMNHKKIWARLERRLTFGKSFDFYPRGRVEIRNGKALIFCSTYLCNEQVKSAVINTFGLCVNNGISSVKVIADGSTHYRSLMLDN